MMTYNSLTVFHSYECDTEGLYEMESVYDWKDFHLQQGLNPGPLDQLNQMSYRGSSLFSNLLLRESV